MGEMQHVIGQFFECDVLQLLQGGTPVHQRLAFGHMLQINGEGWPIRQNIRFDENLVGTKHAR